MRLTKEEKTKYFDFISEILCATGGDKPSDQNQGFRSRISHTRRVLEWSEVLREGYQIDENLLELAIIFHDVGYLQRDKKEHGERGAKIFEAYGYEQGFDIAVIEAVATMIRLHVNKKALHSGLPMETILFLESDLMDEEGAMLVAWDCMVAGRKGATDFMDAYQQLERFYQPVNNPMITPRALKIWEEKQKLRGEFMRQLKRDLFVNKNRP